MNVNSDSTKPSGLMSQINLDVAIERVYANILGGCFPNRLDAAIIKHYRSDVKTRVEELLGADNMDWANDSARYFDLPKQDGLVRPICYIDIDVAVTYQALVDAASKVIEPYVSSSFGNRVLSHKLREPPSSLMFERASEAYDNFIGVQHQVASSGGYSYCLRGCLQSLELVLNLMNEPQIVPQRPDGRTVGDPRPPTPTSQTRRPAPYSGPAGGSERHPVFASERMPLADGPARSASLADPVQVLPQLDHGWNVGTSQ